MKRKKILGFAVLLLTGCASENISYVEQDMTVSTSAIVSNENTTTSEENTITDSEETEPGIDIDSFTWEESFMVDEHKININIKKIENTDEIENATVITAREYTEMTPDEKKNFLTGLFDDGIAYTESKAKIELKKKLDEAIDEYNQNIGGPNQDALWGIVEDLRNRYDEPDDRVPAEKYTEDTYYGMINSNMYEVIFRLNSMNEDGSLMSLDRRISVRLIESEASSEMTINQKQAKEKSDEIIKRIPLEGIISSKNYSGFGTAGEEISDLYHFSYYQGVDPQEYTMHNFAPIMTITDSKGDNVKAYRRSERMISVTISSGGILDQMHISFPYEIKEQVKNVNIPIPEYIKDVVKSELIENLDEYIDKQNVVKKARIDISEMKFSYIYIMDEEDNVYIVPCWKITGINISPIIVNAIDGNVMRNAWITQERLEELKK